MARKSIVKRRPRHSSWPEPKERRGKRGSSAGLSADERAAITAVVDRALGQAPESPRRGLFRRRATPQPDVVEQPQPEPEETVVLPRRRNPTAATDSDRQERIRRGQRARRLPLKAAVGTAYAGYLAWGIGEAAEHFAGPAGHVLVSGATAVTSGAVVAGMRFAVRHRIGRWSRRFWCSGIGASTWATAASVDGAGWGLLGVLAIGTAACSAGWLRAHEVPIPDSGIVEVPTPTTARVDVVGDLAARWAREVSANPKLAPECNLTGGHGLSNRCEFTLELASGMTLAKIRSAHEGIASAMRLDAMQITFAPPLPGANGFRDSSRADVSIILSSPITGAVYYDGPSYNYRNGHGRIGLGPYVDGENWATYELFRPRGMFSGVVIGSTGKGKSSVVNGIVCSARSSGNIVTLYLDPKGNSSPDLARHATVTEIGLDRAELFTQTVETLVRWLGKQASADNEAGFTPGQGRPGYLIVIDECDMLFGMKGMGDRWGLIAKISRSLGAALLLATQYGGTKAFGNSEILRSSIRVGNVVLMRTESNTSDTLIAPDMPKSTTLPTEPGYAYLKNDSSIPAALRSSWLLTGDEDVPAGFPAHLADFNADVALARYPDAPMCPIGRKATELLAGNGTQQERQEARAARLRREIAAFLDGTAPADARPSPEAASMLAGLSTRFAALPGPLANVVPIRRQNTGTPLTPNHAAVLAALKDGATSSGDIADRTGLAGPAVSKILASLADGGLARKESHGRWTTVGETAGRR